MGKEGFSYTLFISDSTLPSLVHLMVASGGMGLNWHQSKMFWGSAGTGSAWISDTTQGTTTTTKTHTNMSFIDHFSHGHLFVQYLVTCCHVFP